MVGAPAQAAGDMAELAFVSIRSGDAQIYTRDGQGRLRAMTDGKAPHSQPAWASNGRLAYTLNSGGTIHVYVTQPDGGAARRVGSGARMEMSPAWSPDARYLAYYGRPQAGGPVELIVVDTVSNQSKVLATSAREMGPTSPSWSADGRRLAYIATDEADAQRNQVWVAERDGSALRNVSAKFAPRGGASPNLSPDGRHLLWVADKRGRTPVVVTEVDSGTSTELTPEPITANEAPRWSPDGKRIVFASLRDAFDTGRNDIFVMDADGSNVRNLTRHPAEDFDAKWSADGHSIIFASLRSGTSLLYEADLATGDVRPVSVHASHDMDHVVRPMAAARTTAAPANR